MDDSGELLQNLIFDGVILLFFSLACAAWQAGRTEATGTGMGIAPGWVVGLARQGFGRKGNTLGYIESPSDKRTVQEHGTIVCPAIYIVRREKQPIVAMSGEGICRKNNVGQICS